MTLLVCSWIGCGRPKTNLFIKFFIALMHSLHAAFILRSMNHSATTQNGKTFVSLTAIAAITVPGSKTYN